MKPSATGLALAPLLAGALLAGALLAGALLALALSAPGAPADGPHAAGPHEYSCPILPASNPINREITDAPVDPRSAAYIAAIGAGAHLHPDFGTNPSYGIPYVVVGPRQPRVPISFSEYGEESNPGPYPVPPDAPVEGAGEEGDRHVLVLQRGSCRLYELYNARRRGRGWEAGSGAVFNLRSNALRPEGFTSADAAGLPIFPLLVRYPEVRAGQIDHALRVTVARTQRGYIHPATHFASSSSDPDLPPMGLRLRLKASYSLAGFHGESLVILRALKRYGLIVADNGSSWYITGAPNPGFDDADLEQLKRVPGSAFEAVETGPILHRG
ncbi:MAG TPA: hypothetical protein VEJ23_04480 [Solirubrobacteraceae bacterium]|nr:hypothetical protein [Solirubrobacteraceae bacterium]